MGRVHVGSFVKDVGAAPVAQDVTSVPFQPAGLMMWCFSGEASGTFVASARPSVGFTTGAAASWSVGMRQGDAATPTTAGTGGCRQQDKALTITTGNGIVNSQCDLTAFLSNGFRVTWTTNTASPFIIHFVAWEDADDIDVEAHVLTLTAAQTLVTQTGLAFRPNLVLLAWCGYGSTTIPSTSGDPNRMGLGAFDAAGNQWAMCVDIDNVSPNESNREQRTDCCVNILTNTAASARASFLRMTDDGYVLEVTDPGTTDDAIIALAIKMPGVKVGSVNKDTGTAPVTQRVSNIGFAPDAYLVASAFQTLGQGPTAHARFGIGAGSVGAGEECGAWHDRDAVATTECDSVDKTDKVFAVVDNTTPAVDAEADHGGMHGDGWDWRWTTNHGTATELLYVAMAGAKTAGTIPATMSSLEGRGVYGEHIDAALSHALMTPFVLTDEEIADLP